MRYSQQTIMAVAVLASSTLAAPIDTRDPANGRKTGLLNAAGSFTNALGGLISGFESIASGLSSRELNDALDLITREIAARDTSDVWTEVTKRDVFDEINTEYDRTIGARDVFDEINSEYERTIGARDVFDEINSEYDRTIGARDVFDEINTEYERTIGARDADSTDSDIWHEVTARDLDDDEEDSELDTRGLFSKKPSAPSTSPATSKTEKLEGASNGIGAIGGIVSGVTGIFDTIKGFFSPPPPPPAVKRSFTPRRAVSFSA